MTGARVVLAMHTALVMASCTSRVVGGLDEAEANRAIIALERAGIPATKGRESRGRSVSWIVSVGKADAAQAREILASLAVSAYQTYTVRAQVAEGLNMAAGAKVPITDAYTHAVVLDSNFTGGDASRAAIDIVDVDSESSTICLSRMPVRVTIHSSLVSSDLAKSALVITREGTYFPQPMMFPYRSMVRFLSENNFMILSHLDLCGWFTNSAER